MTIPNKMERNNRLLSLSVDIDLSGLASPVQWRCSKSSTLSFGGRSSERADARSTRSTLPRPSKAMGQDLSLFLLAVLSATSVWYLAAEAESARAPATPFSPRASVRTIRANSMTPPKVVPALPNHLLPALFSCADTGTL